MPALLQDIFLRLLAGTALPTPVSEVYALNFSISHLGMYVNACDIGAEPESRLVEAQLHVTIELQPTSK